MKPDKRIGQRMMRYERRFCANCASVLSRAWKHSASKARRAEGKRQCREAD